MEFNLGGLEGSGEIPQQLTPEWLQKTSALVDGGLGAAGWRAAPTPTGSAAKAPSRYDTAGGPQRWKDEGTNGRDRWTGGPGTAAPLATGGAGGGWTEVPITGARPYADPFADKWAPAGDPAAAMGRGRGRGLATAAESEWKALNGPRQPDGSQWRGAGSDSLTRTEWRNERWSAAPGSRTVDSWRGGSGAPAGFGVGRGAGAGIAAGFGRPDPKYASSGVGPAGAGGAAAAGGYGAPPRRYPASQFFSTYSSGGGVGGSMAWGPSKAQRRYPTNELAKVYRHLLYAKALHLPAGIDRDDPLLFITEGEFVDVVEQLNGVDSTSASDSYMEHQSVLSRAHSRGLGAPGQGFLDEGSMGPGAGLGAPVNNAHLQNFQQQQHQQQVPQQNVQQHMQQQQNYQQYQPQQHYQQQQQQQMAPMGDPGWVYCDPQGMVQGPFSKQDIIEWFEGGFFPLSLQLRSVLDPSDAPFRPLAELLPMWQAPTMPPGFPSGGGQTIQGNLLAGPMQHLGLDMAPPLPIGSMAMAPAPTAPMQAPISHADPVVDPSIVIKRAPSLSLLQQQGYGGDGQHGGFLAQAPGAPLGPAAPLAEAPRPAWLVAPQQAAPPTDSSSLLSIQQEEQRLAQERHAAEEEEHRQRAAHADAMAAEHERMLQEEEAAAAYGVSGGDTSAALNLPPPPPPPPAAPEPQRLRPETKPAPWVAAASPAPDSTGKSLLAIQQEEEARAREAERQAAVALAASGGNRSNLAGGGWARVARGPTGSGTGSARSLLEIQEEEARLSRAYGEDHHQMGAGDHGANGDVEEEEEGLFWDYGKETEGGNGAPPPPPPPRPVAQPAVAKKGGWAAAAASTRTAPTIVAAPRTSMAAATAASALRKGVAAPAQATSVVRPPPPPPPSAVAAPAAQIPDEEAPEGSALHGVFRSWCADQMQALTGNRDVTLCEFLMTVESNSEVAEYVGTYLGSTPASATFSAEFLKRKLAEQAAVAGGKKSRKARAKANAVAAAVHAGGTGGGGEMGQGSTGGGGGGGGGGANATDSSWAQAAGAGKKAKKKGQKLDTALLAFGTGTNYSLLEQPE